MSFNIDSAIFISFLVLNLVVGLWYSKGTKTMKEYAIGNRDFSTATLAATLVATWISGSFFTTSVSETYKEGLWFFFAALGEVGALSITAIFLAPRIKEFFDSLSVAEVMGKLYGEKIRIVTAICSIAQSVGMTSLQIKVFSTIFSHFLSLSNVAATLISSFVVITYSAVGGIRSVTFTDVIQFLTFGLCIPIFAIFVWQVFGDTKLIMDVFQTNPAFDYREVFNYNNAKFLPSLFLFFYFTVPGLNSTMFQRILMAKDTQQIRHSYLVAALICLFMHTVASFIGLVVLSHNPTLPPNNVAMYVVDHYSFTGLKGLAIVGIMAMIMSTADSWINTGSVIFAHDFCKPLGIKFQNELLLSRAFAVFAGCAAVILALSAADLLKLLLLQGKFYKPIILPPLLLAVLGFRSTTKAVAIGMIAGGVSVILWLNLITPATGIDGIMPSTATNLIVFIMAHYLLKQPGGWIRRKDGTKELAEKQEIPKIKQSNFFFNSILREGVVAYCKRQLPKNDSVYLYFAFASLFTAVITLTLDKTVYINNFVIINQLQAVVLLISTTFFCNKLWPTDFREKYMGLVWHIAIFISLAFVSSFLVFMSHFSQATLIIFVLNLTMIGVLLNWQSALIMILVGVSSSYFLYKSCVGVTPHLPGELNDLQVKIAYVLLMVGGFMLAFLKPKQEYIEATEVKVGALEAEVTHLGHEVTDLSGKVTDLNEQVTHYSQRTVDQEKEIERLGTTAQKILNNVNHELRLPIGNVVNFSEMLHETLGKSDNELVKDLSKEVYDNSNRVSTMILNMLDLATLDVKKVNLQKTTVNFSELVMDRVKICRKIYLRDKKIDFELRIEPEIMIAVDPNYIRQTVDNLVINAINFSTEGLIKVSVSKQKGQVIFTIIDQGKGIPKAELADIFTPFKMGTNTESKACGRGVGLALCKSAVEAHGGSIKAESDGKCGAELQFTLPIG
jgi:Na+/proline symporter/signal transduction histidine kinase